MSHTVYQEMNANIRHYSNIRFASTTLYITVSGGVLYLYREGTLTHESIKYTFLLFGVAWTLFFALFDDAISSHIKKFSEIADLTSPTTHAQGAFRALRTGTWYSPRKLVIKLGFLPIYIGALCVWIYLFLVVPVGNSA